MSDELKPCPLCGIKMTIFDNGNFGHPAEYRKGIESTCVIRGQLFDVSEWRSWQSRPAPVSEEELMEIMDELWKRKHQSLPGFTYTEPTISKKDIVQAILTKLNGGKS